MSETTPAPGPGAAPRPPPLVVNIQYVKDLSFEVPGAPQIYSQLRGQPQVNINLDVQARRVQEGQSVFEVAIVIRAEAHEPSQGNGQSAAVPATVFVAELTYAGVFTLNGLPDNAVEPVLLVECPRILFPFPATSSRMSHGTGASRRCCCSRSILLRCGKLGARRRKGPHRHRRPCSAATSTVGLLPASDQAPSPSCRLRTASSATTAVGVVVALALSATALRAWL